MCAPPALKSEGIKFAWIANADMIRMMAALMDIANVARKGMPGTASNVKRPKALKISQKWMMGTICVQNVSTSMRKRMMMRLSPLMRIMKARLIGRMYAQACPETKNWALPAIKREYGVYMLP